MRRCGVVTLYFAVEILAAFMRRSILVYKFVWRPGGTPVCGTSAVRTVLREWVEEPRLLLHTLYVLERERRERE